ncbi:YiiX/YebB-like N1pC/P60 family cysteine hydrolase [uncultured Endozoicomonas sp.]|uniref:YiiX/YebB-like N1pC/P60 family cysteine hydrolase n=1 Tax=uncultured Endozoicomonas sp. TaxID=432652 RepID=UPI002629DA2C|nr:YiiX/YebB-like N1pC/P60 family cysteine hydrolase [uncultured Endozoicomonas sp.]
MLPPLRLAENLINKPEIFDSIWPGTYAINHVAIYDGDNAVIEAVMPHVKKTTLTEFLDNSVKDNHGRPCVLVCRVLPDHSELIASVLEYAEQQLELPYNSHYQAEPATPDESKAVSCAFLRHQ